MKPILNLGPIMELAEVSDGYHTFSELYEHRFALFVALCKRVDNVWRAKKHADGTMYKGWFVMGIGEARGEQIIYHLPLSKWTVTNFAKTYKLAPLWDGHTSHDVIKRLRKL